MEKTYYVVIGWWPIYDEGVEVELLPYAKLVTTNKIKALAYHSVNTDESLQLIICQVNFKEIDICLDALYDRISQIIETWDEEEWEHYTVTWSNKETPILTIE